MHPLLIRQSFFLHWFITKVKAKVSTKKDEPEELKTTG